MDAIEDYLAKPWLKHYQQGVPETVDVPLESIPQAFDKATERAPERRAVVFYGREHGIALRHFRGHVLQRDHRFGRQEPVRACTRGHTPPSPFLS